MPKDNYLKEPPPEGPVLIPEFDAAKIVITLHPKVYFGRLDKSNYDELIEEIKTKLDDSRRLADQISITPLYNYPWYKCRFCGHYFEWDHEDIKTTPQKPDCCDKAIDTWDPERKDPMWTEEE